MNPSLALIPCAFDTGKLYSVLPDTGLGDFTVSRNGTATYLGADGLLKTALANEPRLEFNTDGTFKGVLVEPSATNLFFRSEEFENATWIKLNTTISQNTAISPSGILTTDKIVENTSNGLHRCGQGNIPVTLGIPVTFSFYAKAGERTFLEIQRINTSGTVFNVLTNNVIDLTTGVIPQVSGATSSGSISVGNGWYRYFVTLTPIATGTGGLNFGLGESISTLLYTGDGTSGVFIWGAQLELGSVATSYIPTVASTVTRPADVIQKTGIADLIGQTEGTFYSQLAPLLPVKSFGVAHSLSDGSNSQLINLLFTSTSGRITISIVNSNGVNLNVNLDGINFLLFNKIAIKWKQNELKILINGSLVYTNLVFNTFIEGSLSQLKFSRGDNQRKFEGLIKNITLFKTALTDAQAIALTTL